MVCEKLRPRVYWLSDPNPTLAKLMPPNPLLFGQDNALLNADWRCAGVDRESIGGEHSATCDTCDVSTVAVAFASAVYCVCSVRVYAAVPVSCGHQFESASSTSPRARITPACAIRYALLFDTATRTRTTDADGAAGTTPGTAGRAAALSPPRCARAAGAADATASTPNAIAPSTRALSARASRVRHRSRSCALGTRGDRVIPAVSVREPRPSAPLGHSV